MSEVIQRYGSTRPVIPNGQNLTITQLNPQTVGTDEFFFDPQMSGGGNFVWDGLTDAPLVGSAFSPSSVVAKSQTSTGTQFQLVGVPSSVVVGQLLHDTTRNSYALVVAKSGTTVTVAQPFDARSPSFIHAPTEDNGWAATDTFQALQPQNVNWLNPQPSSAGRCFFWVQGINVTAISGALWANRPLGVNMVWWLCTFTNGISSFFDGSNCGQASLSNYAPGLFLYGCVGPSSSLYYRVQMSGGQFTGATVENCLLDNDCALAGSGALASTLLGFTSLVAVQLTAGAVLNVQGSGATCNLSSSSSILWGQGTIDVLNGAKLVNGSAAASLWTTILAVASILLDLDNTAWTPPATGTFTNVGATQVTTAGVSGTNAFPINAPISWALKTVSGSLTQQPYFSQAQAANSFFTKTSAGDTSVYQWTAGPGTDTLSAANLANYVSMTNPFTGSGYITLDAT